MSGDLPSNKALVYFHIIRWKSLNAGDFLDKTRDFAFGKISKFSVNNDSLLLTDVMRQNSRPCFSAFCDVGYRILIFLSRFFVLSFLLLYFYRH